MRDRRGSDRHALSAHFMTWYKRSRRAHARPASGSDVRVVQYASACSGIRVARAFTSWGESWPILSNRRESASAGAEEREHTARVVGRRFIAVRAVVVLHRLEDVEEVELA